MKAPKRIYLQVCGDCPGIDCKSCKFEDLADNVTWCVDRIFDKDKKYISEDWLYSWLKKMHKESAGLSDELSIGRADAYGVVIGMLNNLQ